MLGYRMDTVRSCQTNRTLDNDTGSMWKQTVNRRWSLAEEMNGESRRRKGILETQCLRSLYLDLTISGRQD